MAFETTDALMDIVNRLEAIQDHPDLDAGQKALLEQAITKVDQVVNEILDDV